MWLLSHTLDKLVSLWPHTRESHSEPDLAGAHKLKPGGSITFIGGGNGTKPAPNAHQAGAINAATEGLARGLAKDLSPTRVNVVSPGIVDTALWAQVLSNFCFCFCRDAEFQN